MPEVYLATIAVVLGSAALSSMWLHISRVWWSDPLRVIGAAFPAIALLGVLGAWRRLGWRLDGSLWGLLPIAIAIQLSRFVNVATSFWFLQGQYWREVHPGPVLLLYAAGATLLFGGWRLTKAAALPLCLLLCINPVPNVFSIYFDLPLQQLSAGTARAFAHLIGLHPTGEQLRMMFTPDFGMLIVPGCNGIRGAVTLAYLALIYGYTRRLRPATLFAAGFVALLLGYAMNLMRLCLLVVYYRIGISVPSIQDYGTQVDYAIGCTVFLVGTTALGFLVRFLEPKGNTAARTPEEVPLRAGLTRGSFLLRVACFVLLTGVAIFEARAMLAPERWRMANESQIVQVFPAAVGEYALVRTYSEAQYANGGAPSMVLGEYEAPAGADGIPRRITLGLWVNSGFHRLYDSKMIRGVKPVWSRAFEAKSGASLPIAVGSSLYDDGVTREFDAETNCTETGCENPMLTYETFKASDYLGSADGNRLPILLRMEWPDSDPATTEQMYARFVANVRAFLGRLDTQTLVAHAGRPLD